MADHRNLPDRSPRGPSSRRTPPAGGDAPAPAPSQPLADRACDADREQVIGVLKAAFVQERLTRDEFEARVGHALISRTRTDLAALTADLPRPASSRPRGPLRTAATVAGLAGALVAVLGGLLALEAWNEQRTDGALTASYAAGIAVSSDMRLGVTAQSSGPGAPCCDLVWRIGAHPGLLAHFAGVAPVAFAPGSHTLLAASPTGVTEWSLADPARPAPIATMPGPGAAAGIAYAPGHPTVAVSYPTAVQLWDVASPAAPHLITTVPVAAHVTGPVPYSSVQEQIAFSPDGRTLATTAAGHAVSLWDVSTPTAPRHLATIGRDTGPIAALAFSPAGSQLAYLGQDGQLTVFAPTDPAHPVRAAIPFPAAALVQWGNYELAYSPDGTRLTAVVLIEETGGPRVICTWNTTSLSRPLPVHCRTDQFPSTGAFTFIASGTAIVGPDPRGPSQLSDTLSIWPPLPA